MVSVNVRIPFVHFIRRLLSSLLVSSARTRRRRLGVAFGTGAHSLDSADAPTSAASEPNGPAASQPAAQASRGDQNYSREEPEPFEDREPYSWPIHELMRSPTLFAPVRTPRHPIVLCHGLYGFDVRGPSSFPRLQMHYWSNVLDVLRNTVGASVLVAAVPSTGTIQTRAESMDAFLRQRAQGKALNFMAHSMGGLDCRHLITHIRPREYTPLSLTTISTPHQGSPFMDWCLANIGIGASRHPHQPFPRPTSLPYSLKNPLLERPTKTREAVDLLSAATLASLPSSFTTVLLGLIDSPAYSNLTTYFLKNQFNPSTPDVEGVKYISIAGRIASVSILHPLWLPKLILDAACAPSEGGNDGLVSVRSARWGEFLGVLEECDHWDMRGARGLSGSVENLLDVFKPKQQRFQQEFGEKRSASAEEEGETQRRVRDALHDSAEAQRHDGRREEDAEVKSSTDRLSSVFDWIADHVPIGGGDKDKDKAKQKPKPKEEKRKSDLASRVDLERLYVALCRKLYDEGL